MADNPRDQAIRLLSQAQAAAMRRERAIVSDVAGAYERARRDLVTQLMDAWQALGGRPAPADIRRLAGNLALIRAIEARLEALAREHRGILAAGLADIVTPGLDAAAAELAIYAAAADIALPVFAIDPILALTIQPAIEQIPALAATMRAGILAELRERLASGDRISDIARAALGREASAFRRGALSAELMTRRAIVQAENNARLLYYEAARPSLPGLQKQAIAAVGSPSVTDLCLRVHGQIQPLDRPFELVGSPSFGRRQMAPAFHWNCRTRIVAYMAQFETSSSITTASMRALARAQLAARQA